MQRQIRSNLICPWHHALDYLPWYLLYNCTQFYHENKCLVYNFIYLLPSVYELVTPFYIVSYYIKWVTTFWKYGTYCTNGRGIADLVLPVAQHHSLLPSTLKTNNSSYYQAIRIQCNLICKKHWEFKKLLFSLLISPYNKAVAINSDAIGSCVSKKSCPFV